VSSDALPYDSIYLMLAAMGGIVALVATATGNAPVRGFALGAFVGGVFGFVLTHYGVLGS